MRWILLIFLTLAACTDSGEIERMKEQKVDSFKMWCNYMDSSNKYIGLSAEATGKSTQWIRESNQKNIPYDKFMNRLNKLDSVADSLLKLGYKYHDSAWHYFTISSITR